MSSSTLRYWIIAWIIAATYLLAYAWMIHHHTAEPYWDQSNYITKTYNLAEDFHNSSLLHRFNPDLYMDAQPPMRPPLMMLLPALIWRRVATPHQITYAWLFQRTLFLLAGMWVLSRIAKDARWVPAALFAILGSSYFLQLDPAIYLMDLPFASLALLSVALVLFAMQRRSFFSYLAAAIGTLALFLVKPQGAAFMFPFLAILCIERAYHAIKTRRALLTLIASAGVMLALLLTFMHLLNGTYGNAVKAQYAWGQEGYWNNTLTWSLAGQVIGGLCPLWMLLILLIAALLRLRKKSADQFQPPVVEGLPRITLTFLLALAFWLTFNLFLTYAIDPRIAWSFMPLVLCAAAIALARLHPHKHFLTTITSIAGILFIFALTITLFGWPTQSIDLPLMLAGPPITQQHPVPESGERNLVRQVDRIIRAGPPALPATQPIQVTVLMCQPYAEYSGMVLAARWENHDEWSPTHYEQFPFGDTGFDLANEFDSTRVSWFLTRKGSSPDAVSPRSLVNMRAMEALITDPQSPIHDAFESREAVLVNTPADKLEIPRLTNTIPLSADPNAAILWHLTRPLTPSELEKSLAYIQPFYKGGVGEARMALKPPDSSSHAPAPRSPDASPSNPDRFPESHSASSAPPPASPH